METKEGNNMDDLLVKRLLGEATQKELDDISAWLSESQENKRYFEHFDLIWQKSKKLASESHVDSQEAWNRFKGRVDRQERKSVVIPLNRNRWPHFVRIAAVFILLLGAGWFLYLFKAKDTALQQIVSRSGDKPRTDTLPDGSVVTMNARSIISYPAQFSGDIRTVSLSGEAFFRVTPNKERPFIITANNVTVRVVGTSFNVKTSVEKTEVVVETGVVEVAREKRKVTLKPEQKVVITKDAPDFRKEKSNDAFYNYYRTGKLVCNHTPLWRLVEILNGIYQTDIVVVGEQLKHRPIDATFEGQTLEEILGIIGVTFNIEVMHKGKQIILQ